MKIPFSPPYIDDDIKAEVLATLESGWITSGQRVLTLEKLVAELTQTDFAACCNSATSGLMLALHWFGVTKGDEVIIPAYTYAATALVVMHLGATPVMVDSGPDFNINVQKIREKITTKTKAIMPVDIAGWPCDYQELRTILDQPDVRRLFQPANETQEKLGRILILADSAHSIGAGYHGSSIGKWADLMVLSFHAVKNITTAEGGAICINLPPPFDRAAVYKILKLWSLNGQTKDALTKTQGGDWRYDIVYPGFKINMPDICAAIGIVQVGKYKSMLLPARKEIYEWYAAGLSVFGWVELPPADTELKKSSYHLYALRIRKITDAQRDKIMMKISDAGVSVNVHFQPLPILTVFRERGYKIEDFPVAFDNYSREISLPIYPGLEKKHIDYIVASVVNAYQSVVHG